MPAIPQKLAGWRMEPPVSVAVAPRARRAATAAAEPPDEPPGTSWRLSPARVHGLITGPKAEVALEEPMANSSRLALPRKMAPSRSRLAETVLSYGGTNGSRMRLAAVVRTPWVQNRSLIASGMPVSGPWSPRASAASAAAAWARARSGVIVMKAFNTGFNVSIAVRKWLVSSSADTSRLRSAARALARVKSEIITQPPSAR